VVVTPCPPDALSPALPFGGPRWPSYEDVMSLSVRRGFLWPPSNSMAASTASTTTGTRRPSSETMGRLLIETFLGLSGNYYLIDTTTILPESRAEGVRPCGSLYGHPRHVHAMRESYRGDNFSKPQPHENRKASRRERSTPDLGAQDPCPNCKGVLARLGNST